MARLSRVTSEEAPIGAKIAYFFTRRALTKMTGGKAPEDMLEPLEVLANVPNLMKSYGRFEQAAAKTKLLDHRHRVLAELKAATMTECEYCIDIGSQVARKAGLSDNELLALPHYRDAECFSEVDKLVLDYAYGMSQAPVAVSDELFDQLKRHFDTAQLVELTFAIALENFRGRFNLALDIGAAGFSEGMVCAVPETAGLSASAANGSQARSAI